MMTKGCQHDVRLGDLRQPTGCPLASLRPLASSAQPCLGLQTVNQLKKSIVYTTAQRMLRPALGS